MNQFPISNRLDDEESFTRGFRLAMVGLGLLVCLGISALALMRNQTGFVSLYNRYFPTQTSTSTPAPTLTATLTTTPTATFTSTPNLTATQSAFRTTSTALAIQSTATQAVSGWSEIFSETFDNNRGGWLENSVDLEYAKMTFKVQEGGYRWNAVAHKGFIDWIPLPTKSVDDFFLTLDASLGDHTGTNDYGILFRNDAEGNFYYFSIDSENEYSLFKFYKSEWSIIINRTFTHLIKKDQMNRLTVIVAGNHMILFINDQYVADAYDDAIKKGSIAFAIEIFEPDQKAIFEFDNIVLRTP